MSLLTQANKIIKQFGVPIMVTKADGTARDSIIGAYVTKTVRPQTGESSLEVYTTQTLYVAGNTKFPPDVNDIVTINKTRKRITSIENLSLKGAVVLYILELT